MSLATDLEYVKANYDVLELVRELQEDLYGASAHSLVRLGTDHDQKTRCPIHEDSQPSAKVYVESNSVYCWVCGRTWDPVGLWMTYHGLRMPEAVRALLGRLGIKPAPDLRAAYALRSREAPALTAEQFNAWATRVWSWALGWVGPRTADGTPPRPWYDEVIEVLPLAAAVETPADGRRWVEEVISWAGRVDEAHALPSLRVPADDPEWLALVGIRA